MSDFLKQVVDSAREVSEEILNVVNKLVETEPTDEKQVYTLEEQVEDLENDIAALSDELAEARTALKLFLDGEMSKTFEVSSTRSDTLDDYVVDTWWEGESDNDLRLVVKQRRV